MIVPFTDEQIEAQLVTHMPEGRKLVGARIKTQVCLTPELPLSGPPKQVPRCLSQRAAKVR